MMEQILSIHKKKLDISYTINKSRYLYQATFNVYRCNNELIDYRNSMDPWIICCGPGYNV